MSLGQFKDKPGFFSPRMNSLLNFVVPTMVLGSTACIEWNYDSLGQQFSKEQENVSLSISSTSNSISSVLS
jgi:hypothetical protein